jgi:lipopolysaccharide export system protein LptC
VLPLFTDKEGFRTMTLRGSEVRPVGTDIAVTDLNITIFSGDAAAKVDSILLSRQARFFPKANRAAGDDAVRYIRDDIEVTGVGWTYDHTTKKISLRRQVRVTFTAQLNDILK